MVELRYHIATRVGRVLFILLVPVLVRAQKPSSEDVNKANNPLTPAITVNFQDQGQPKLYDLNQGANSFLLRGVLPHKLFGLHQIVRFTLPTVTTPDGTGGMTAGLGDLNLFDLAIFPMKKARRAVGFGPQLTLPTALETLTGTGKWQAGFAAVAVMPRKWGIAGALPDMAALLCRRQHTPRTERPGLPAAVYLQPAHRILSALDCELELRH
jgi:hypothetical protein